MPKVCVIFIMLWGIILSKLHSHQSDLDRLLDMPNLQKDMIYQIADVAKTDDKLLLKELEKKLGKLYKEEESLKAKIEEEALAHEDFKQLAIFQIKHLKEKLEKINKWNDDNLSTTLHYELNSILDSN